MWSTDYSEEEYVKRRREWQGVLADGAGRVTTWPHRARGRGGRPIEGAIFNQEQARLGVSNGVFAIAIGMVGPTLLEHGTDDQKRRFLRPMLKGDEVWCQLSPNRRPDPTWRRSPPERRRRRRVGRHRAEGLDVGRPRAEWGSSPRTDPDVPKHKGITYFLVDMRTPGIDIRPLRQMTGDAHFSEVFLDDVRIPAANVLGEVGEGRRASRPRWPASARPSPAARVAPTRRDSSRWPSSAVADDPLVRQAVVEAHLRSELLRYLRLRSQTALSKGERPGPEGSVMKLGTRASCSR